MIREKSVSKFVSFVLALLLVCSMFSMLSLSASGAPADKEEMEELINEVLSGMSLQERARIMLGGRMGDPGQSGWVNQTSAVPAKGLGKMDMSDGPMGVNAKGGMTSFGSGLIIASTWNRDLAYEVGNVIGKEALAKDIQWFLSPAFNINRDLAGGRVFEYYSEDPYLSAHVAVPYVQGVQDNEILVTLKHFIANNQEMNRNFMSSNVSERAMHEIYLPAFEAAVEADSWGVMTGANRVNGVFSSDSRYLLTNLNKYDYGLQGINLTDWINVRTGVISAKAGLDLAMPYSPDSYYAQLVNYVRRGELDESVVNASAQRMLRTAMLTKSMTTVEGVDLTGYYPADRPQGELTTPRNHSITRLVAEEGITLLKNDEVSGSKLLPIDKSADIKIAMLGKYVDYEFQRVGLGGSGWTSPNYQVTNWEGVRDALGGESKLLRPGYNELNMTQTIADAVAAASTADYAIVFAGINSTNARTHDEDDTVADTEDGDRANLNFPDNQKDLIKAVAAANPNTIVILNGSMFVVGDWIGDVPAVMQQYYSGMEGGNAMASILFGDISPSGSLTNTWPKTYEETVGYIDPQGSGKSQFALKRNDLDYDEGIYVGYRWYDKQGITPEFAFGHGLSYVDFEYSNLSFSNGGNLNPDGTITVSVDVKNSGTMDAKETIQLYVKDNTGIVDRPSKELKGYEKVLIPSGETLRVSLDLDVKSLSYWDVDQHSFMAKGGSYTVYLGRGIDDIRISDNITLTADSQPNPDYMVLQETAATLSGATTATGTDVDGRGVGYIDFNSGSEAEWNVNVSEAGEYSIIIHYSNPNFSGPVEASYGENKVTTLKINGEEMGAFDFQNTRHNYVWNFDSIDVDLNAGSNTITLVGTDASDDLLIDKLIVQTIKRTFPKAVPVTVIDEDVEIPEVGEGGSIYQMEKSAVKSGAFIDNQRPGYTGTGYVVLKGNDSEVVTNIIASTPVLHTFTYTYSNGSNKTMEVALFVDGIMEGTIYLPPTGGWTVWKKMQSPPLQMSTMGIHEIKLVSRSSGEVSLDKVVVSEGMTPTPLELEVLSSNPLDSKEAAFDNEITLFFNRPINLTGSETATLTDEDSGTLGCSFTLENNYKLKITTSGAMAPEKRYELVLDKASVKAFNNQQMPEDFVLNFSSAKLESTTADNENIDYDGSWIDNGTNKESGALGDTMTLWVAGDFAKIQLSGNGQVEMRVGEYADNGDRGKSIVTVDGGTTLDTGGINGVGKIIVKVLSGSIVVNGVNISKGGTLAQPLDRSGWALSADATHGTVTPSQAMDDNISTRWIKGADQRPDDWFQIDLGSTKPFNGFLMSNGPSDFPAGYQVLVSDNGSDWTTVSSGNGTAHYTVNLFSMQTARYVRIKLTESTNSKWWAIHELWLFNIESDSVVIPEPLDYLYSESANEQIILGWEVAPEELGAVEYVIYRDGEKIATVKENSFVDITAKNGVDYVYEVTIKTADGTESGKSASVTVGADETKVALERSQWKVTAVAAHSTRPVEGMIDGDDETYWTSGKPAAPGDWVQIDMLRPYKFNTVDLISNTTDYFNEYKLETSLDGKAWSTAATGAGKPDQMKIELDDPAGARFVRLVYTATAKGSWLCIKEINLSMISDDAPNPNPSAILAKGYNGQINISWKAPTDGGVVSEYIIHRDANEYAQTNATAYMDLDVSEGESYEYFVEAVFDDTTVSAPTETVSATIDASVVRLPQLGWTGDASHKVTSQTGKDAPRDAFDGDNNTRWTSQSPQTNTMWFMADFGSPYIFTDLHILNNADYPKGYELYVSYDGVNWGDPIASGAGTTGTTSMTFEPVVAQYVKVASTDNDDVAWWSINELYLENNGAGMPALPVSKVVLNKSSTNILVGASEQLIAEVLPSNAGNKTLAWESDDELVATVGDDGTVHGVSEGTAVITVTTEDGGKTATCTVSVTETAIAVTGVSLNKADIILSVGGIEALSATIQPATATNQTVLWKSENPSVAAVSAGGSVRGVGEGTTTVSVTTADGGFSAECTVTVETAGTGNIPVTSVEIRPSKLRLLPGESGLLTAAIVPSNATNQTVVWESDNESVAAVDGSGMVSAGEIGTATVKVTTVDGNKTATCIVTVSESEIVATSITLNRTSATLEVGGTERLMVSFVPSNANSEHIYWESDDESIVIVDEKGVATGVFEGTGTVTATTEQTGLTASCVITVIAGKTTPQPSPSYQVSAGSGRSSIGTSVADKSTNVPTKAAATAATTVKSETAVNLTKEAVETAKKNSKTTAVVTVKNAGNITLDTMKAMGTAASGTPLKLQADTMAPDGKTVSVRLSFDPTKAARDISLSASTALGQTEKTKGIFEKWFTNKIVVVSLGHQGSFGVPVEVAVRVDLMGMDTKNLQLYSYDKAANSFVRLTNPSYFIDTNGFLHFTAQQGGDIIISEGLLKK